MVSVNSLFITVAACVFSAVLLTGNGSVYAEVDDFISFRKAIDGGDDINAASIGDIIFNRFEQKFKDNAGFQTYKSKLTAADVLVQQMRQQLKKTKIAFISKVDSSLFGEANTGTEESSVSVTPAKYFCDTSRNLFSKPVKISGLENTEKDFLSRYYDLKLRMLTGAAAKAGQVLIIADPAFRETYDYVLVLPLLHTSDKESSNIDILPVWMQHHSHLDMFSDSCLLHFGLPFHAMKIAEKAAQIRGKSLSELDFYRFAAEKHGKTFPLIAADCLRRAIDIVPDNEVNQIMTLESELVQLRLNAGNYELAAGEAQKILEKYRNNTASEKFVWLYYYALSKSNNAAQILVNIDNILADRRYEAYKPGLMYIKWWALRSKKPESAEIEALAYELLRRYGDDPIVAPVLLAQATDLLEKRDFRGTIKLLNQLLEKFPSTEAAAQGRQILSELENVK